MKDISVIVPFVNEFPQIAFTVQSIIAELQHSGLNFEVICVDNWCEEVATQIGKGDGPREQDDGSRWMNDIQRKREDYLRVYQYTDKLSHWQAKNLGVQNSKGRLLWFCDAHCIVSPDTLSRMAHYYLRHQPDGSMHLPLSYLLERNGNELIYKFVWEPDNGVAHYTFTRYGSYPRDRVIEIPAMSTCGMLISRELYDLLGGWPKELGIYGGGENFINFTLAVLGKKKYIYPAAQPLWHYAAKRGYHWNYNDYHRNRMIATFMYGGPQMTHLYADKMKGKDPVKKWICNDVLTKCVTHRQHIARNQKMTIEEWAAQWHPEPSYRDPDLPAVM